MELKEILNFIEDEHKIIIKRLNLENNPIKSYTMLAKITEELGELSEAILANQNLQRKEKLSKHYDIGAEMADVILTTLILAKDLNINISKSIEEKITKVKSRRKE